MALIKCPECDHIVSDKAHKCPQCGMPRPAEYLISYTQEETANFHQDRGIKRMEDGDNKGAIDDFNKVIYLIPNHALIHETYLNLGVVQARAGNNSEALIATNKAIEINPNYKEAYKNRDLINKDIKSNKFNNKGIESILKILMVPFGIVLLSVGRIVLKEIFRYLFGS
tara:strand:- start:154 stop:660 length:507 start_codon:yes stop_codon:yes gene_type:complete